jgi:UrcA family protein
MKKISSIACVAVALGLIGASPAFAADESDNVDTQTIQVFYPDLNLARNKDAHLLFMRLQNAAADVCGDSFDAATLSERMQVEQCQQDAIANAVVKVNEPLLTAVYDKHYDARRGQG